MIFLENLDLMEAGACGTYSLANYCPGGINEIIQNNINGEISTIEDHEGFSRQIVRILHEEHDKEAIRIEEELGTVAAYAGRSVLRAR